MIGNQRNGVFLSYARRDGEDFANSLREHLRDKAPHIDIKQDRILLEGGVGWWKQLTEAIDSVEFLVLVMTPSAMQSETVRKEWRYARQQGVCVYPVKAAPDSELKFPELPRWMRKAHFYDLEKEWESFIAHLHKGCDSPRVPFMAPDLPENFVQREEEFYQLKNLLLSGDRKEPIAITTALSGAGGFGKTTLAVALCHDEDIIQNFDDGILWVTLGQNPNVMSGLVTVYAALSGNRPDFVSGEDAVNYLGQKLEDRNCLLVIDDVWDDGHLKPFLHAGKSCARLFTTRDSNIATETARAINVNEMSSGESQALLTKGVPGLSLERASELSQRLGEWPIALEIAAAMMRQRIEQGDSAERAAHRLTQILEKKGPRGMAKGTGAHRTIGSVVAGSLELLSEEDRSRLIGLSIFPRATSIPLTAAASLWGFDESDAEELAQHFARLSLLKLDLSNGSVSLHDIMQDWLASATSNAAKLHSRLVGSWPDWMQLPDAYAWRWLPWHLHKAGRKENIEKLLWNPVWLKAKLAATDISALIADFDYLKGSPEAEVIQGALRLSSHAIAKDPSQFPSQMIGRLLTLANQPRIQQLIDSLLQSAERPWLRPWWPTLDPPRTALLRSMAVHIGPFVGPEVSKDGRRAAIASSDNTVRVWDLEAGVELRTLEGHSYRITSVSMSADGHRIVSVSEDGTLRVWDVESGTEEYVLGDRYGPIAAVAMTPDGRRAVSISRLPIYDANGSNPFEALIVWDLKDPCKPRMLLGDLEATKDVAISADGRKAVSGSETGTLKVWDLETGTELHTLAGHSDSVNAVAMTTNGLDAISASSDKTLKVWCLESGTEVRTLVGHSDSVRAVAVTVDGRFAVSASLDKTLKVWDMKSGSELCTICHSNSPFLGVAITDTKCIVSASGDGTLKIWNLEWRGEPPNLTGHSDRVSSVAVTPDGLRVVSASYDKTIKVWDLASRAELHTLLGHSDAVSSVTVTRDGRRVVSASYDKTIKVWDLESGAALHTLFGHSDRVSSVALTPDGHRVVSASYDRTIKIWDLVSGAALHTLFGHSEGITGIAVTADGQRVVSASLDKSIKVWDLASGAELHTLLDQRDLFTSVVVATDGRQAISGSVCGALMFWDLERKTKVRTLRAHSYGPNDAAEEAACHSFGLTITADARLAAFIASISYRPKDNADEAVYQVSGLAITTDGRLAVSTALDKKLKVWDMGSGQAVATFVCDASVNCCALIDDRRIIAGDDAGRIHLLTLEFPQPR